MVEHNPQESLKETTINTMATRTLGVHSGKLTYQWKMDPD